MNREELEKKDMTISDSFEDWYDDQFSIEKFRDRLISSDKKAKEIIDIIIDCFGSAENNDEETEYVVNMPDEIKEGIKNGTIRLDKGKNGELYAQLRDMGGHYSDKLSISEKLEENGISTKEVEMALQTQAMRNILVKLVEMLGDIGEHVCDIIRGQQNDRIGLYYSGMSLYVESKAINDEYLRKQVVSQAIKSLNDANSQMIQQIRSDIQYLSTKEYNKEKGRRQDRIDEKITDINNCFDIIYRSSFMKAAIYSEIGELSTMLISCEEYGKFIEKLLLPNNEMLTEMDKNDIRLDCTIWEKRAKQLIEFNDVKQITNNNNTYTIQIKEKDLCKKTIE